MRGRGRPPRAFRSTSLVFPNGALVSEPDPWGLKASAFNVGAAGGGARARTMFIRAADVADVAMAIDLGVLLAFAFGAGMVAFFAPCCAAMLPAYVSFTLGREAAGAQAAPGEVSRRRRELGALAVWGGLLVAALGLGRLALEAFGAGAPEERGTFVALAAGGIVLAMAGFAATANARAMRDG